MENQTLIGAKAKIVAQQILMDWHGYILESSDTIFDTRRMSLRHRPASEWSYFFNSLVPVIHLLELSSPEIFLPRISSVTNFMQGMFDCTFMRVQWGDNDHVLVWTVFDHTQKLPYLREAQQKLNEIRLREREFWI